MLKLLLVDDEVLILEGLEKILLHASIPIAEIKTALDAFEALEVLATFTPDVVITDLNMPEQDGLEFIQNARQVSSCSRFIILTGYDEFEYARQAVRVGALDYLLKPINDQEIISRLQSIAAELGGVEDAEECGGQQNHMTRILHYINDHYHEDLSLNILADLTNLHPNYISSMFRKETGQPFIQYLNHYRIQKACEALVKHPYMPVLQIGRQSGFENPQHFTKVFKKRIGKTPGAYREEAVVANN